MVALLSAIQDRITAPGSLAVHTAMIRESIGVVLTLVALLPQLHNTISAAGSSCPLQAAICIAAIGCHSVTWSVVTLLAEIHLPITADWQECLQSAIVRASVSITRIAIVAVLPRLEDAITTAGLNLALEPAIRSAPIAGETIRWPVIALLSRFHNGIPAARQERLERAG